MRNVAHFNRYRLGPDTSGHKCFRIDESGYTGVRILNHGTEKDYLDQSVQTRIAMRRRMDTGGILLAERSSVLRYLAESELPVSPCAVASVHFHRELHGGGAFCVFCRTG